MTSCQYLHLERERISEFASRTLPEDIFIGSGVSSTKGVRAWLNTVRDNMRHAQEAARLRLQDGLAEYAKVVHFEVFAPAPVSILLRYPLSKRHNLTLIVPRADIKSLQAVLSSRPLDMSFHGVVSIQPAYVEVQGRRYSTFGMQRSLAVEVALTPPRGQAFDDERAFSVVAVRAKRQTVDLNTVSTQFVFERLSDAFDADYFIQQIRPRVIEWVQSGAAWKVRD